MISIILIAQEVLKTTSMKKQQQLESLEAIIASDSRIHKHQLQVSK